MIKDLYEIALNGFLDGIKASDPAVAVRKFLADKPEILDSPNAAGRLIYLAVGKAAVPMMKEIAQQQRPDHAILVTNYGNEPDKNDPLHHFCQSIAAGHPIPDQNGFMAGRLIIELLKTTSAEDRVILLLSGGGSALLPAPVEPLTLDDKAFINQLLITSGADIHEINIIRKHLSLLKGGGLARLSAPASVISLILSDVPSNNIGSIASGPTVENLSSLKDVQDILHKYRLWDKIPALIKQVFEKENSAANKIITNAENHIVACGLDALKAIKVSMPADWHVVMQEDYLIGDVEDAVQKIYNDMQQLATDNRHCNMAVLYSGETTVRVNGNGLGGRNQELAIRFILCTEEKPLPKQIKEWVFLSGGTDGIDGVTDAAGGIVDQHSLEQIIAKKIDPVKLINNNDSYSLLKACDGLIITGATRTNVADVQILMMRID